MTLNKDIFTEDLKTTPYWWEAYKPVTGDLAEVPKTARVAIVGGGYAGLSCAIELADAGIEACVFESAELGAGASTRSGGAVSGGVNIGKSFTGKVTTLEPDVLKNILVVRGDKPDTETIIKVVAEAMQVKPQDIKGDRRQQNIARARQVAMYLTRRITGLSYPVIGEKFGGKDHSTVINAEQRIDQLMNEEPDLSKTVQSLFRRLNS